MTADIGNNIVTEYCRQHYELAGIRPDSGCTLRIIMGKMPYRNHYEEARWHNIIAFARFGTSGTGNLSQGGVGVGFDCETGKCKDFGRRYRNFSEGGQQFCTAHPDTGVARKDLTLPNWAYVRDAVDRVCRQICSPDYTGLDVIITEDGMKICGINPHPAIDNNRLLCAPVLADPRAKEFFDHYGLDKVDTEQFYSTYARCLI